MLQREKVEWCFLSSCGLIKTFIPDQVSYTILASQFFYLLLDLSACINYSSCWSYIIEVSLFINWFDVCVQFNQTCCLRFLLRLSVSEPLLINGTSDSIFECCYCILLFHILFWLMVVDTFFFQSYNVCLFYQKINWKWIFIWTLFILIHITLFFFVISYSSLCYPL